MLRNHLDELSDVVLVHSAPSEADVIFGAELRRWAAEGRIRLVERHTATQGLLTPAELESVVPDWREREAWGCGPTGLLDALEAHWAAAELSDRLHTERFRPVVITEGEGGTLSFTRQGSVVEADGATPILDVGEDAGVLMPSGCRMGICFGCVVPLTEGAVRDLRNGELITASAGDGVRIQTCVSAAAGSCTIDL
jgi:ferredoxin